MCHNLEWQLGQIQKYANTHHVWGLKSQEISFAFAKWEEVGKVFFNKSCTYLQKLQLEALWKSELMRTNFPRINFLKEISSKYLQNQHKLLVFPCRSIIIKQRATSAFSAFCSCRSADERARTDQHSDGITRLVF